MADWKRIECDHDHMMIWYDHDHDHGDNDDEDGDYATIMNMIIMMVYTIYGGLKMNRIRFERVFDIFFKTILPNQQYSIRF